MRRSPTLRLFRFATAGSVDDGKSTLVGRLLHDSKAILADQLDAVARTSADRGFGGAGAAGVQAIDLALLTDGLRAEREQGITIDVAYRYFATDRRSFILADCPGHVQYTKNTVTGASTADAVVVLIDARKGVLEQTRRHLSVLQLLRVAHVIVAVNKIDLVDFSEAVFREIEADVQKVGRELGLGADGIADLLVIPVSALDGDNVVDRSDRTPWYDGPALLEVLETLPAADELESHLESFRFPVQLVIRPQGALAPDAVAGGLDVEGYRDYRAYAGQITEGSVKVGDKVSVLTPGQAPRTTTVTGIDFAGRELTEAVAPQSVALRLADEFDVARGDTIAAAGHRRGKPSRRPVRRPVLALAETPPRRRQGAGQARHPHGPGPGPERDREAGPRQLPAGTHLHAGTQRHRPRPAAARRPAAAGELPAPPPHRGVPGDRSAGRQHPRRRPRQGPSRRPRGRALLDLTLPRRPRRRRRKRPGSP